MQNNFLKAKSLIKPCTFAEALSLHARLACIKLKDCTTLDELKTLAFHSLKSILPYTKPIL